MHDAPEQYGLSPALLSQAFPFHFILNRSLEFSQVGAGLQRLCPAVQVGVALTEVFTIQRPTVTLDFAVLFEHAHQVFILRQGTDAVTLRGQLLGDAEQGVLIFLGTPWLTTPEALVRMGLTAHDFPPHNPLMDLLQLVQTQRMAAADMQRLADRLAAQKKELHDANAALKRAMQLKDEFLATMSHELRTPLTAILGHADLFHRGVYGALTEKQHKPLQHITESGQHLLALLSDALDFSKTEAGHMEIERQPVDLATLCDESVRLVAESARHRDIQLQVHRTELSGTLLGDHRRLKQALVNLLSNAIKFTPPGGQVGLDVAGNGTQVQLLVWDTGIGIDEADFPKLFHAFTQLDSRLARQHDGTGLGLALVHQFAKLHNGDISVESTLGQGSRFCLTLPLADADTQASALAENADVPSQRHGAPTAVPSPHDGALILVAEDNAVNADILQAFLEEEGYRVALVGDGAAAVAFVKEHLPQLVIMDIQMPGMDGLEATRQIRADLSTRLPIIAVTALSMPGDKERCLAAGADAHITKPPNFDVLAQTITRLLSV